jgi:hypothetical protein
MRDKGDLSGDQIKITETVTANARKIAGNLDTICVAKTDMRKVITSLRRSVAPGSDGITAEHLQFGCSEVLCDVLCDIYSMMLSHAIVPSLFKTGVIIPVIKKATCDPNVPKSYRPITLSSLHCKITELLISPSEVDISSLQFGFRSGRGTTMVTSLINDLASYFMHQGSPLYVSSMDAEKCFDNIWHDGLMFKLQDIFVPNYWLFLYNWYKSSSAYVKWDTDTSNTFSTPRVCDKEVCFHQFCLVFSRMTC